MKATSLIFRRLSQADFKNISGQGGVEGGGGQGYIDISTKGVTIDMMYNFLGKETSMGAKGPRWEFKINSLFVQGSEQNATIYQRRDSSFCIASQKIGTRESNRINVWKTEKTNFPDITYDEQNNPLVVFIIKDANGDFWAGWFYVNDGEKYQMNSIVASMFIKDEGYISFSTPTCFSTDEYQWPFKFHFIDKYYIPKEEKEIISSNKNYLTAIRTKPFLLLAGISGTGKSRIVRELAFKSCPKYLQDKDGTTPGNYCMIEVKPNWHDSTELLGYYSNLSMSYQFKKFVKFLIKAKMFPDVPFFVCLDEMNLAPVEQYFAEILSVLETRKHPQKEDGGVDMSTIKTGVIVEGKYFSQIYQKDIASVISTVEKRISDGDWYASFFKEDQMPDEERTIVQKSRSEFSLCDEGLSLPDNVIIIGTVNMDDTTHPFSRKVIDRAMTIEMNGGKLKNMFGGSRNLAYLEEEEQQKWQAAFKQNYVSADEVLDTHADKADDIVNLLPEKLESINVALKGTPFEVSYRVLNELTIMVGVMLDNSPEEELVTIVNNALDRVLLMKILPRIEGDSEMFSLKESLTVGNVTCHNRLEWLRELAPAITIHNDENGDHQQTAKEKIEEMIERLNNQEFTRFWP